MTGARVRGSAAGSWAAVLTGVHPRYHRPIVAVRGSVSLELRPGIARSGERGLRAIGIVDYWGNLAKLHLVVLTQ